MNARRTDRQRLPPADRMLLFRQLQLLLSSGVLLSEALRCLRDRFPRRAVRRLLGRIHSEVAQSRRRFSAALAQYPRSFPPGDIALIAAGESGGSAQLAERLGDLADRIEYESRHRRALRQACAYPLAVLILAGALLTFLVTVVMPRLEEMLRSLSADLPPLARAVVGAARVGRTRLPAALAAVLMGILAWRLARRWPRCARLLDRAVLAMPVVGDIYRDFTVALICKIYRSLYLSNQQAPAILEACICLTGNQAVRLALRSARVRIVQHGTRLSAALERTGLFSPLAILSIEVGEKSGQLAEALDQISRHFQERAQERVRRAIALINPLLTVGVVGSVGVIMVAFFQALYQVVYVAH